MSKSDGRLIVNYSSRALHLVAIASLLVTAALIARSFVEPAALKGLFASILFFVISIVMMRNATYVFDLTARTLGYRVFGPLFKKKKGQISFDQIKNVELEYSRDSDGDGYRIAVDLADQKFLLNDTFEDKAHQIECFKQVHEAIFNRLPDMDKISAARSIESPLIKLENYSSENVLILVRERKFIEAIKLVRKETGCGLKDAKEYVDKLVK